MGTPLTFEVDVVPGKAYEVMILTGDARGTTTSSNSRFGIRLSGFVRS